MSECLGLSSTLHTLLRRCRLPDLDRVAF